MRCAVLFLLVAVCFSSVSSKRNGTFFPQDSKFVMTMQVDMIARYIRDNNVVMLRKLVKTPKDDEKNIVKLHTLAPRIHIKVVNVTFDSTDNSIKGQVQLSRFADEATVLPMMTWHMIMDAASPTGWIVDSVGAQVEGVRKGFSMCYVGIFWCIIEVTARTADGDW